MRDGYALVPSAPTGARDAEVLGLVLAAEPWMQEALCAETDPEAFFPEKGGSTKEAKQVCASCDVRAECLAYALRTSQTHGIWGGLSRQERNKLTRGRKAA